MLVHAVSGHFEWVCATENPATKTTNKKATRRFLSCRDMMPNSLNWSDTMLKSLGIFLTLAMLVALLSACSDASPPPTESDAAGDDTSVSTSSARSAATPGSASAPTSESRLVVAPGGNDNAETTPPDLTPLPSSPSAGRSAKPTPMPDQVTAEAIRMMEVLETSGEAMRELESVHFRLDNIVSFEMAGFPAVSAPTFLEGDYQAPDRYRYDGSLGPVLGTQFVSHVVVIGPRMYVDGAIVVDEVALPHLRFSLSALDVGPLFPEGGDVDPKLLEGVTMTVTEFEGDSVYHLSAPLSGEALRSALEDAYASQSVSGSGPIQADAALDNQSQGAQAVLDAEGHTEIWIGVDDYLVRKSYTFLKQRFRDPSSGEEIVYATDGATSFSGYNEAVNIQAP